MKAGTQGHSLLMMLHHWEVGTSNSTVEVQWKFATVPILLGSYSYEVTITN